MSDYLKLANKEVKKYLEQETISEESILKLSGFSKSTNLTQESLTNILQAIGKEIEEKKEDFRKLEKAIKTQIQKDVLAKRNNMAKAFQRDNDIAEKQSVGNQSENEERLNQFEKIKVLGTGNFSVKFFVIIIYVNFIKEIYLVEDSKNNNEVSALKIFNKEKVTRIRKHQDILMEKYALEKLKDSKYVIDLLETFKDDINLCMRFEALQDGELWDIMKEFG